MRKIIFISLLCVFFNASSCHFASYYLLTKVERVDFSTGRWLINYVGGEQIGPVICGRLHKFALEKFQKVLGDRISDVRHSGNIILPSNIPLNPSPYILENIKKGTGFDYFINIKADLVHDSFGTIQMSRPDPEINDRNEIQVVVEIYDLNTAEVISTQTSGGIIGSRQGYRLAGGFSISTDKSNLAMGALNKILKKLVR